MRVGDEFLVHLTENKTAGICKVTREYYYDTQPTWGDANSYPHRIGFEPIKVPAKPIDAKAVYDEHLREKHRTSGGYFGNPIRQISDLEFSVFESDLDKNLDGEKTTQSKENYSVFLTGYDNSNLQISEQNSLLGWGDRTGKLTEGDIVFAFDTTNHKIKSCFRILNPSNNRNPIWHEETTSSSPSKIIYPYRWDAHLIDISTNKIFEFQPFRNDKKIFSLLIRNRHPRSLNNPQYDEFRNFLLDKVNLELHLSGNQNEPYSIDKLYENTMVISNKIEEWEDLLNERKQVIFYGPPGTGKTYVAIEFSKYLISKYGGEYKIAQFHPSYGYEEFIEGISPKLTNGQLDYQTSDGIFKILAKNARQNPMKKFILIIDEVNRGNLSKIFGELIFNLEYRGDSSKVILPYSKESFAIPENLWIIGTMNSADRSIALVDYALRRRFYFVEFMPDAEILEKCLLRERYQPSSISVDKIKSFFENMNRIIADDEKLGRHYQLGHSYLIKETLDETKIRRIWKYGIIPILEEYYFEEPEQMAKFGKDAEEILGFKLTEDIREEHNMR